ncbi:histone protein, partial [Streptomyces tateyamensis]
MKNAKLAAALAGGYLLGRFHKARWALALAGLAAGKKLSSNPEVLLGELLDSSPQLRKLADTARGELKEAGKKAAVAVATNRVGALADRLEEHTEKLREGSSGQEEDQQDGADEEYEDGQEPDDSQDSEEGQEEDEE